MLETLIFSDTRQIKAYADPIRLRMLNLLIEKPMTGSQLARLLDIPRQRVHYHLHLLEENGLIVLEEERVHRGLLEKIYRAVARNYHTPDSRLLDGGYDLVREAGVDDYIIESMLEQVNVDIKKRRPLPSEGIPDNFIQSNGMLTKEQRLALGRELRAINQKFAQYEEANQKEGLQDLVHSRITLFLLQIRDPLDDDKETGEANDANEPLEDLPQEAKPD
jgi:DNA-binding transcriptional ArsR family regulator